MRSRPGASTTAARWSSTGSRNSPSSASARPRSTTWGQPPALGHGCARLPVPARDPHHRSHRALASGSARANQELDLPPLRQAHTPRPQDVRPAATLRAPPRRTPSRTPLHRAPHGPAARRRSISRAHAVEPRPSEQSTVVLLSSPASSKAPARRAARCSAPLLIRHSRISNHAACDPKNHQYQTSATRCRIRDELPNTPSAMQNPSGYNRYSARDRPLTSF